MSPAQRPPWHSRRGEPTKLSPCVFDPDRLVWTSREEVTSALLSAIDDGPERATCALDLCEDVAAPSAASALLAIARARDRPYWARVYALRAHAATGATVPDDACESLFAEWFFARGAPRSHGLDAPGAFELRDLLGVVKTASQERVAMRWLAIATADERAVALIESFCAYGNPAPVTTAWLGEQWLAREGEGVSDENNRMVASMVFPTRPEGLAVMRRRWADRRRQGEAFYFDLSRAPGLVALLDDGERYDAACALRLPIDALLHALVAAARHAPVSLRRVRRTRAWRSPALGRRRRALRRGAGT